VIEHVFEEVADAAVTSAVLVTSAAKAELARQLGLPDTAGVATETVIQPHPRGLGDAVLCARGRAGEGPFAVALGDTVVGGGTLARLVAAVAAGADGAIAVERVPRERLSRYGVVATGADGVITALVEKPEPGAEPSDLAVAARYVLPQDVFALLAATEPGLGGEIQLSDALAALVAAGARIAAVPLAPGARREDVGSPAGYTAAFVSHALRDPELAVAVRSAVDEER
jgi:UTP--glucose-1-phosphate uridylyltransferase